MIKFENVVTPSAEQWKSIILGARNAMNSWNRSDSHGCGGYDIDCDWCEKDMKKCGKFYIGEKDLDLMKRLRNAGTDHRKFMRMITVYVDITAPMYWWKEMDTYQVGVVKNSCSTMHKIHANKFIIDDFSAEHLYSDELDFFKELISHLNGARELYLESKKKEDWWQMIQLLPSSYNQKRTVMLNYEVLANIYKSRRNHKLDEWAETKLVGDCPANMYPNKFTNGFCDWIKTLPYSELITGEKNDLYTKLREEAEKEGIR